MKKIFSVLLILYALSSIGQELTIAQDLKLATLQDNYGNEPVTVDLLLRYSQYYESGGIAGLSFEYANLKSNYFRLSYNLGYAYLSKKQFSSKLMLGVGMIHHNHIWYHSSFDLNNEFTLKLYKNLNLSLLIQYTFRSDIQKMRFSTFVGLNYMIW